MILLFILVWGMFAGWIARPGFEQLPELQLEKPDGTDIYADKAETQTRDDGTWLYGERTVAAAQSAEWESLDAPIPVGRPALAAEAG